MDDVLKDFYFCLRKYFKETSLVLNYDLSKCSSIGIGGKAVLFVKVFSLNELIFLMKEINKRRIRYKVVGQCTNLIFEDEGFNGVIFRLCGSFFKKIKLEDDGILCGGGAVARSLLDFACKNEIKGFEFLTGIPGTLGGIVKTNAGSFGKDISSVLKKIYTVNHRGEVVEIEKKRLIFQYRKTKNIGNKVIYQLLLSKRKGSYEKIKSMIEKYYKMRFTRQPKGRTVGSIFKNPKNDYAWRLIDKCGFRGFVKGGIEVSRKHPNWLVNVKNGKADDVIYLIKKIRKEVKKNFGINLELEVELVKK